MIYKISGNVAYYGPVKEGKSPEESVVEYLKELSNENCQIKVTGQVTEINVEFDVIVNALVEAEDPDDAMEIAEIELDRCIPNCECTWRRLRWDNQDKNKNKV